MSGIRTVARLGDPAASATPAAAGRSRGPGAVEPAGGALDGVEVHFDGALHNRPELLSRLRTGARPDAAPRSDAALVAAAYRRWGERCPEHLIGEFAFALADPARGRLVCGRDAMGVRPLYWARRDGALAVASDVAGALALPGLSRQLDPIAAIRHLAFDCADLEETLFLRVRRLPPGHRLTADAGGVRVERYWRPDPEARTGLRGDGEMVERFAELFERAVADRVAGRGSTALLLSGGIDSSSVAVQACSVLGPGSGPAIRALTFTFSGLEGCDESEFAAALEGPELALERLPAERHPYLYAALRPPLDTPFLGWESGIRAAFEALRRGGARVVLTGYGGDGLLVGTARTYAEALRRGDLRALLEMAGHARRSGQPVAGLVWRQGVKPLVPARLRRLLRPGSLRAAAVPPWIPASRLRAAGVAERRARRDGESARERIYRGALDDGYLDRCLDWLDRRGREAGVELGHPYLDRRLVEYVLSLPPRMLFRAGQRKYVLRAALADRLPAPIRQRTRKTMLSPFFHSSLRSPEGAATLRAAFREPYAARAGWVDAAALRAGCERYLAGENRWGAHLWSALSLELWIAAHAGAIDTPAAA